MKHPLPLQALRAFVEVGQRGSIKAAAEALHVTSGAVSQQIRLLEERVGMPLFTRERQGLRLTEAGAMVHPALLAAFAQIASAIRISRCAWKRHPHWWTCVATGSTWRCATAWATIRACR